eukprot:9753689-Lingulodinium_polyedra.AAC.1
MPCPSTCSTGSCRGFSTRRDCSTSSPSICTKQSSPTSASLRAVVCPMRCAEYGETTTGWLPFGDDLRRRHGH